MSQASEWARRTRMERPTLNLIATDCSREPGLYAQVTIEGSCEVRISYPHIVQQIIIPAAYTGVLGRFLIETFSDLPDMLHGRPHDRKMAEDHE